MVGPTILLLAAVYKYRILSLSLSLSYDLFTQTILTHYCNLKAILH